MDKLGNCNIVSFCASIEDSMSVVVQNQIGPNTKESRDLRVEIAQRKPAVFPP